MNNYEYSDRDISFGRGVPEMPMRGEGMLTEWIDDKAVSSMETLKNFTNMELAFRNYYRMKQGMDVCSEAEGSARKRAFEHYYKIVFQKDHGNYGVLPDGKFPFFPRGPISIMKHPRYLPANPHVHSFIECFYVFEGECTHVCDGINYPLKKGDFCLWRPNAPHYIDAKSDECIAINVLIQKDAFQRTFLGVLMEQNILRDYFHTILYGEGDSPSICFHTGEDSAFRILMLDLYQEYEANSIFSQTLMSSQVNQMFVHLLRYHQGHITTESHAHQFDSALEILNYIQNQEEDLKLSDLAAEFHYSEAYLSRLIRKKTGKTFSQLLQEKKMKKAAWLLKYTEKSIGDISREVGCSDTSHFCRMFAKVFQQTPGEYRKKEDTL